MSIKFTKILGSLKNNWQLWAGLITIVLIAIGSIQSYRASKWQAEALRLDGKLTEQQADQDKLYGDATVERAEWHVAEAEAREKRENLEARIRKFQRDTVTAKKALRQEKEKTAKLEPTELVAEIVERIGFESDLIKSGLYLFTRKGAERTLDRFKDGEFYLSEYNKFQTVLAEHDTEVASFNESISECEGMVTTNLEGWDDCRETLATAQKDIFALKKVGKASVWQGRKQGAIAVAVIAGVLKLAGVW